MAKSLLEVYRKAARIHEGYQIHTTADEWLTVAQVLRIYAPANIVRFDLADGSAVVCHRVTRS